MSDSNPNIPSSATPAPNKHTAKLLAKAESLGVPGNMSLAQYVLILEDRLETLEAKLGIKKSK